MYEANIEVLFCLQNFNAINAKYSHPVSTVDHNGEVIQALPHSIISASDLYSGGSIDSKLNSYLSPYLKIEPNHYSVSIKQLCSFKFNVQWRSQTNQMQLSIQAYLYILNKQMSFTPVGSQTFKLRKLTGRSTYLPMFFEGFQYTCYANASVHTQLIGLKWKKGGELQEGDSKPNKEIVNKPIYNSFTEYLIGQTSMSLSLLTDISQKYTKLLLGSIGKLQHLIQRIEPGSIKFQIPELNTLNTSDPNEWGFRFLNNINELSGYCYQLWNQYIRLRTTFPDMQQLRQTFQSQLKYQYKRHIYGQLCQETKSQKMIERNINNEIIVVGDLRLPRSVKVFVERGDLSLIKTIKNHIPQKIEHVVVLVHGLSANRMAMEALKNILLYYFPHLIVVTSISNEYRTEEHIEQMGKRLAEEVRFIISSQKLQSYKLSFICHSLGGLITRAALLHLESFKQHFQSLITLGTPHLGYLFHHSYLVKVGIWFLNRFKQSLSLSMLNFTDKLNLNQSYLYRLSMQPGFQWFKHIILISNPKDSYVSQHSALIQNCEDAVSDKQSNGERGNLYHEILNNLTQRLNRSKTTRVTVHGLLSTKTGMDNIIGRTAHIEYLSDNTFLKMFVLSHENLFRE